MGYKLFATKLNAPSYFVGVYNHPVTASQAITTLRYAGLWPKGYSAQLDGLAAPAVCLQLNGRHWDAVPAGEQFVTMPATLPGLK